MSRTKLKNAPLKEVVFELGWIGGFYQTGVKTDPDFDLAQGKFAAKLQKRFHVHRRLIPDNAPVRIFGAPIHQYWTGELKWPVIQHGPGIITVNQTDHEYEWEDNYKPLVISAINDLLDSYDVPPNFNKVKLQYIDAYDLNEADIVGFMKSNLQTEIITGYEAPGDLLNISIQQRFRLPDKTIMSLSISDGINNKNGSKSVIWTTTTEKKASMSYDEIIEWLEIAHSATSDFFKKMLSPEFYASLDR